MQGPLAPQAGRNIAAATARSRKSGTAHDGLAGADWSAINRLAGYWSSAAGRHAGARSLRLRSLAGCWTGLLQAREDIGARGHHRSSRGLTGKIRTCDGPLGLSGRAWARSRTGAWGGRSFNGCGGLCRSRAHGRAGRRNHCRSLRPWRRWSRWRGRGQRLPRAG